MELWDEIFAKFASGELPAFGLEFLSLGAGARVALWISRSIS
jgi:hypothetical protein